MSALHESSHSCLQDPLAPLDSVRPGHLPVVEMQNQQRRRMRKGWSVPRNLHEAYEFRGLSSAVAAYPLSRGFPPAYPPAHFSTAQGSLELLESAAMQAHQTFAQIPEGMHPSSHGPAMINYYLDRYIGF